MLDYSLSSCSYLHICVRPSCPVSLGMSCLDSDTLCWATAHVEILVALLGLRNSVPGRLHPLPVGMPSLLCSDFDTPVGAAIPLSKHPPRTSQALTLLFTVSPLLLCGFLPCSAPPNGFSNELFMKGNGTQCIFKC